MLHGSRDSRLWAGLAPVISVPLLRVTLHICCLAKGDVCSPRSQVVNISGPLPQVVLFLDCGISSRAPGHLSPWTQNEGYGRRRLTGHAHILMSCVRRTPLRNSFCHCTLSTLWDTHFPSPPWSLPQPSLLASGKESSSLGGRGLPCARRNSKPKQWVESGGGGFCFLGLPGKHEVEKIG